MPQSGKIRLEVDDLARSFAFFPVVGMLLGLAWWGLAEVMRPRVPPLLLAVLLSAFLVVVTRGLHLDGLADLADGVGGGYSPQRRLEIMKDSSIGTFGATALILALSLRIAALQTVLASDHLGVLALAPTLSRLAMVLAAFRSTYARAEGGLGKSFCEHITFREVAVAAVTAAAFCSFIDLTTASLLCLLVLACVGTLRLASRRWLGGITGDVLGALNEITEVVILAAAACLMHS